VNRQLPTHVTPLGAAVIEPTSTTRSLPAAACSARSSPRARPSATRTSRSSSRSSPTSRPRWTCASAFDTVRSALLDAAGQSLGIPARPSRSTVSSPWSARSKPASARERSAELRGLPRRDRSRARHQPRAHASGAVLPRPPDPDGRRRARGRVHARRRQRAHRASRPPPRPERAGLAMTQISTFFGLQQTLRGLLAHQRAMETTGQNITNANTEGYSRQVVNLSAATPYEVEAGLLVDGGGAQLGGGVDIMYFQRVARRIPGPPVPRAEPAPGQLRRHVVGAGAGSGGLRGAERHGISKLLDNYWSAWHSVADNPENDATRQALIEQGKTLARRGQRAAEPHHADRRTDNQQFGALTGPTGDVQSTPTRSAKLNGAIKNSVANGRQPERPLRPPRPAARQAVRPRPGVGRRQRRRLDQRQLRRRGHRARRRRHGHLAAGADEPRRQARRADRPDQARRRPRGLLDRHERVRHVRWPTASTLSTTRAARARTSSPTPPCNEAASLAVSATTSSVYYTSGTGGRRNDVATAIAAMRVGAADQTYQTLVAKIGSDVKNLRAPGRQRKRCSPTPSTIAARASPASRWTRR